MYYMCSFLFRTPRHIGTENCRVCIVANRDHNTAKWFYLANIIEYFQLVIFRSYLTENDKEISRNRNTDTINCMLWTERYRFRFAGKSINNHQLSSSCAVCGIRANIFLIMINFRLIYIVLYECYACIFAYINLCECLCDILSAYITHTPYCY